MAEEKEPKVESAHESTWGMTDAAKQAWHDKHGASSTRKAGKGKDKDAKGNE